MIKKEDQAATETKVDRHHVVTGRDVDAEATAVEAIIEARTVVAHPSMMSKETAKAVAEEVPQGDISAETSAEEEAVEGHVLRMDRAKIRVVMRINVEPPVHVIADVDRHARGARILILNPPIIRYIRFTLYK